MFGLTFKSRVKNIVEGPLSYKIPSHAEIILSGSCKQARAAGMNEFDAAIFFISIMMNSLVRPGMDPNHRRFVDRQSCLAWGLISRASAPRAEVMGFLDAIREGAELAPLTSGVLCNSTENTQLTTVHQTSAEPIGSPIQDDASLSATVEELFDLLDDSPDDPQAVVGKLVGFLIACGVLYPEVARTVISSFYLCLKDMGGYGAIERKSYDELYDLAVTLRNNGKTEPTLQRRLNFLVFWSLIQCRSEHSGIEDERRELEALNFSCEEHLVSARRWREAETDLINGLAGLARNLSRRNRKQQG
jgi:hypothetical protein